MLLPDRAGITLHSISSAATVLEWSCSVSHGICVMFARYHEILFKVLPVKINR